MPPKGARVQSSKAKPRDTKPRDAKTRKAAAPAEPTDPVRPDYASSDASSDADPADRPESDPDFEPAESDAEETDDDSEHDSEHVLDDEVSDAASDAASDAISETIDSEGESASQFISSAQSITISDMNDVLHPHAIDRVQIAPPDQRTTSASLTRFEIAAIISHRATQISQTGEYHISTASTDAIEIATEELSQRRCPLLVKRVRSDGVMEIWSPNEMTIVYD